MTLTKRRLCGAVVGLLVLGAATAPLAAQPVSYVREVAFPPLGEPPVLLSVKAPVDTSDPLYDPARPDTQWLFTDLFFFTFDPGTGLVAVPLTFPPHIKTSPGGLNALSGVGTSTQIVKVLGFRNTLWVYDTGTNQIVGPLLGVSVPVGVAYSLAAPNRSDLTVIADGGFRAIDHINLTGEKATVTQVLAFDGGSAPREFNSDTRYHAYAPNGFVYLLDYGNNRVQWLDPANDFAFVNEFPLEAGVTTANMQFAIGSTGNLHFGDGLGGGSSYDADGAYLGSFTLPPSVTGSAFVGDPYVSAGQHGIVFVFDDTGFHQYVDASVVEVTPPGGFGKSSPADGTVQPFDLVLSWTASSDAMGYEYCLDTSHNGACNTSWVPVGAATSVAVTGLPAGTPHSWQVRANNANGTTHANGSVTAFWSFGTTGTFGKSSPSYGATAQSIDSVLSWSESGAATSYEYCLDTSHDGACNTNWVPVGLATSVAMTGLPAGTSHSWQVRANNAVGTIYADDSAAAFWRFTTGGLTTPPPVSYVRDLDLTLPPGQFVLPTVKAPVDTSDPLYDPALPDTQRMFLAIAFSLIDNFVVTFDPGTGVFAPPFSLPPGIGLGQTALTTLSGVGTSAPMVTFLGHFSRLYVYDFGAQGIVGPEDGVTTSLVEPHSIAAPNRSGLTVITNGKLHSIDRVTNPDVATVTEILAFDDSSAPGQFSLDTRYHAYAPNGSVYLLDYGNNRVQRLNPAEGFEYVDEFPLEAGVTIANMQFAIGPTGHIHLGDGFGGGSSYDADGAYLGNFTFPSPVTGAAFVGVPHVSTDAGGGVYVFDTTGFHQYLPIADDVVGFKDSFEDLPL